MSNSPSKSIVIDEVNRKLHYLLDGECPVYPNSARSCNTFICDCGSKYAEWTEFEMLNELIRRKHDPKNNSNNSL